MQVALLTESVDWNKSINGIFKRCFGRSPHGERGLKFTTQKPPYWTALMSLSSRRAWIEIEINIKAVRRKLVALLTESVDWNVSCGNSYWLNNFVALLTESVDWNVFLDPIIPIIRCRSPHGERGLKCFVENSETDSNKVALLTESVDWNSWFLQKR